MWGARRSPYGAGSRGCPTSRTRRDGEVKELILAVCFEMYCLLSPFCSVRFSVAWAQRGLILPGLSVSGSVPVCVERRWRLYVCRLLGICPDSGANNRRNQTARGGHSKQGQHWMQCADGSEGGARTVGRAGDDVMRCKEVGAVGCRAVQCGGEMEGLETDGERWMDINLLPM